jgi:hypothetical protein
MIADITLADRAEQRIGESVKDDISIAMTRKAAAVRDQQAAQPELLALGEGMDIEAEAGAADQAGGEPGLRSVEIFNIG